ncbi:hypothetical protein HYC85_020387 [Camellia sinensis]|uniref:Glutamyl-tRNA reductase N-terminal domain-containing protein n=1 Tax=Camellia sinensis TaxID=4442 RepID=A0A7J7GRB6_CAMSI|nr:hypothetical protein HYC85_020387 [Camellia sinensis]
MAVASAFAGAKLETLLLSNTAAVAASSPAVAASQIRVLCKPLGATRPLIHRARPTIRCQAASDVFLQTPDMIDPNTALASPSPSLSALEQLKISAADMCHTAPVEMREKLAIPEAEWPRAIEELCGLNHIEEAAVLSTCNRMEIYVVALSQHRGVKEVTEWMSKTSGIPIPDICEHRFLLV